MSQSLHNPARTIDVFVHQHLDSAPLRQQIDVAEAMATIAATPEEKQSWETHAAELRSVEDDMQQLWFNFRMRTRA